MKKIVAWLGLALVVGCNTGAIQVGSTGSSGSDAGSTDASNAGPSGPSAPVPGVPTILASLQGSAAFFLASDGQNLFWIGPQYGTIATMPITGGTPTTFYSSVAGGVEGFLFADAGYLFFLTDSGIAQLSTAGGTPTILANSEHVRGSAATILDGTLYWLNIPNWNPDSAVPTTLLSLYSMSTQGGAITHIADFAPSPEEPAQAFGVTSQTAFIYDTTTLETLPLVGGSSVTPLPTGVDGFAHFASDSDAVYWSSNTTINRLTNDGTSTQLATAFNAAAIAIDSTNIYWLNDIDTGAVMTVPKAGGAAVTLTTEESPMSIAVDSHAVYWGTNDGSIKSLSR